MIGSAQLDGPLPEGGGSQAGFSLVELLVALAVGLFLMAGIIQLLIQSKVSYSAEENFSRLQESGRFAVQAISRDARMARSLGCRNLMLEEVLGTLSLVSCDLLIAQHQGAGQCNGPSFIASDRPLGYDFSWGDDTAVRGSDLPNAVQVAYARGDVLVLWGAAGPATYVTNAISNTAAAVDIAAPSDALRPGDIALITDCEGSDLFTISGTANGGSTLQHRQGVNTSDNLSRLYNNRPQDALVPGAVNRAVIFPFDFRIYFVCSSTLAKTGSALCRWQPRNGTRELVADVVDMRLTYSGDANGDGALDYFARSEPTPTARWVSGNADWSNVYSAQVEVLVASGDEVRSERAAVSDPSWPGGASDRLGAGLPDDRHLHERFGFTVALRTRAPWYVQR